MSKLKEIFRGKGQYDLGNQWRKIDEQILLAVESNDRTKLRKLLEKKGSIATKIDPKGHTALHRAAFQGRVEVLKVLLTFKADTNAQDAQGRVPLHDACRYGQLETAHVLLRHNNNADKAVDHYELSPLHHACIGGREDCVALLLKYKAPVDSVDKEGRTPLFYGAKLGYLEICKLLIHFQANYNWRDKEKKTPLIAAVEHAQVLVCEYLIKCGAIIYLTDCHGHSAKWYAEKKEFHAILKILTDALSPDDMGGIEAEGAQSRFTTIMYHDVGTDVMEEEEEQAGGAPSDQSNRRNHVIDVDIVPLEEFMKVDEEHRRREEAGDNSLTCEALVTHEHGDEELVEDERRAEAPEQGDLEVEWLKRDLEKEKAKSGDFEEEIIYLRKKLDDLRRNARSVATLDSAINYFEEAEEKRSSPVSSEDELEELARFHELQQAHELEVACLRDRIKDLERRIDQLLESSSRGDDDEMESEKQRAEEFARRLVELEAEKTRVERELGALLEREASLKGKVRECGEIIRSLREEGERLLARIADLEAENRKLKAQAAENESGYIRMGEMQPQTTQDEELRALSERVQQLQVENEQLQRTNSIAPNQEKNIVDFWENRDADFLALQRKIMEIEDENEELKVQLQHLKVENNRLLDERDRTKEKTKELQEQTESILKEKIQLSEAICKTEHMAKAMKQGDGSLQEQILNMRRTNEDLEKYNKQLDEKLRQETAEHKAQSADSEKEIEELFHRLMELEQENQEMSKKIKEKDQRLEVERQKHVDQLSAKNCEGDRGMEKSGQLEEVLKKIKSLEEENNDLKYTLSHLSKRDQNMLEIGDKEKDLAERLHFAEMKNQELEEQLKYLPGIEDQNLYLQDENKQLQELISVIQEENRQYQALVQENSHLRALVHEHQVGCSDLGETISTLKKENKQLRTELASSSGEVDSVRKQMELEKDATLEILSSLQQENSTMKNSNSDMRTELEALRESLQMNGEVTEKLRNENEGLRKETAELGESLKKYKTFVLELEEKLKASEELGDLCENVSFENDKRDIKRLREENEKLQNDLVRLMEENEDQVEELRKEKEKHRNEIGDKVDARSGIENQAVVERSRQIEKLLDEEKKHSRELERLVEEQTNKESERVERKLNEERQQHVLEMESFERQSKEKQREERETLNKEAEKLKSELQTILAREKEAHKEEIDEVMKRERMKREQEMAVCLEEHEKETRAFQTFLDQEKAKRREESESMIREREELRLKLEKSLKKEHEYQAKYQELEKLLDKTKASHETALEKVEKISPKKEVTEEEQRKELEKQINEERKYRKELEELLSNEKAIYRQEMDDALKEERRQHREEMETLRKRRKNVEDENQQLRSEMEQMIQLMREKRNKFQVERSSYTLEYSPDAEGMTSGEGRRRASSMGESDKLIAAENKRLKDYAEELKEALKKTREELLRAREAIAEKRAVNADSANFGEMEKLKKEVDKLRIANQALAKETLAFEMRTRQAEENGKVSKRKALELCEENEKLRKRLHQNTESSLKSPRDGREEVEVSRLVDRSENFPKKEVTESLKQVLTNEKIVQATQKESPASSPGKESTTASEEALLKRRVTQLYAENEQIVRLQEENALLRDRLKLFEDRLSNAGIDSKLRMIYDLQCKIDRLQKQLEDKEEQHREVVATYRSHLLAAVQGSIDPIVNDALQQIIRIKRSRPSSREGLYGSRREVSPVARY